ncbi:MAG TPA: BLUF domain-containing protein [Stellaceae bacterium]|nr:BLUF domain-containing protein [Stellaceae bacterium]
MLHTLVYVSCATRLWSAGVLGEILQQSRRKNPRLGITGLLLYVDGNFMQALEGEEKAVLGLYEEIRRDPRHKNVTTIISTPCERRAFPQWAMAFREAEELPPEERAGITRFLDEVREGGAVAPANFASRLLRDFAANMR